MLSLKKAVPMVIFTCFILPSPVTAIESVQAKIGIEIIKDGKKGSGKYAKPRPMKNILSSNESLMVQVTPESDLAYIYIINSNTKGAELLNPKEYLAKKAQTRIFPMANQSYKPDGKNEEFITVITSAEEQMKVETLFADGSVSFEKWKQMEEDLLKNRPGLTPNKPDSRLKMGGSVRGLGSRTPTSFGIGWIVKRYQFNVKN